MPELRVKKRRFLDDGQLEVTLDSKEKFVLDPVLYDLRELEEGMEVDEKLYKSLESDKLLSKCRKKASDLLFRRMHAKGELRKKLYTKNEFPITFIEKVISEMESFGYLNDKKFALEFCKELSRKAYGPRLIRQKMYQRGLDGSLINEIVQEFTESKQDNDEELLRLAQKKLKSLHRETDEFKKRQKLYRFLAGKGWGGGEINRVIEKIFKGR